MELTREQIADRIREDVGEIEASIESSPDPKSKGRKRKTPGGALQGRNHRIKTCAVCNLPRHLKLRVEEDFVNWHSTRQISDSLMLMGFNISKMTVYTHCVLMGLDVKRGNTMEKGLARLVEVGFSKLETGELKINASDLINALTLWAKLKGLLSDQAINNILIRNNLPTLEEIAKEKDASKLGDRATQIVHQLQKAGYIPGAVKNRVEGLVVPDGGKDASHA